MKKLFSILLALCMCFTFSACSASSEDTGTPADSSMPSDTQQTPEQQEPQPPEAAGNTNTPSENQSNYDPSADLNYDGYEILDVFQDGQFSVTEYSLDGKIHLYLMSMNVMVYPDADNRLSFGCDQLPDGCELVVEVSCGDSLLYADTCSIDAPNGSAKFTYFADCQLLPEDLVLMRAYARTPDGTVVAGVDMISIVDR